jgi:hypothetical protein
MAFREKILWSSVIATLAVWGWYFAGFVSALRAGHVDQGAAVGAFIVAVIVLVAVQVVAAVVLALASPKEAGARADARERAFALAAYRPAYFVMSTMIALLMIAGPVLLRIANEIEPGPPHGLMPVLLGNATLLTLVLGNLVHSIAQIISYRRGG